MKISSSLLKDDDDTFLVNTTALINESNPVVDRIMDHDSVVAVLMANREGAPILTNTTVASATRYSTGMQALGVMVQNMLMELDPLDEALVFRIKTLKEELLVAPHKDFSIVVVQREKKWVKRGNKKAETIKRTSETQSKILK